ncbi:hypothetical protein K1X12_09540 [Hyphomonas sp. WL0036]|uniref:hypothetical protein n=1 Tax=Hyphomonas sediminis TaxID=2866160 RepID=UPI001C804A9B|nr:hypothetical protein [Hyphomonas sediminis]MBY9067141.1 hypothetical protein [Hyphomonas sediminis]
MIRWVLAAAFLIFSAAPLAFADTRDVYTIRNIEVDQQAATVIQAREAAMTAARIRAARLLIEKITLASDRAAVGGVSVDAALAARLTAAVDVQEETAGAGRYVGKLAVVLNPQAVRAHLTSLKLPYLDSQAPLALMIPVTSSGATADSWRQAFGVRNDGALVPYVTAVGNFYSAYSAWPEISAEAVPANARRALIADLQGRDGAWRVVVSAVTAAGNEPVGATPPAPTLEAAALAVSTLLGESWKQASIVRDGSRTTVEASVRYTSLAEWSTLRGALARSPLVSDFRTEAVAREGALVTFAYAGDENRLRSDLVQRGVSLAREEGKLTLRSAVSQTGIQ